jgi:hypothetical protein
MFAALDICVPGICQTDGVELFSFKVAQHGISLMENGQGNSRHAVYEDDCFCCCSHIIHSQVIALEVSVVTNPMVPRNRLHQTSQMASNHFHPPRI